MFFPSVLSHCWLGDRKGIRPVNKVGCWFVGDDDLTGALHILQLQLSSLPPPSLAQIESRMKTFAYRLTHVLEKYPLKQREREREREYCVQCPVMHEQTVSLSSVVRYLSCVAACCLVLIASCCEFRLQKSALLLFLLAWNGIWNSLPESTVGSYHSLRIGQITSEVFRLKLMARLSLYATR